MLHTDVTETTVRAAAELQLTET